jgi:hypothetical protein
VVADWSQKRCREVASGSWCHALESHDRLVSTVAEQEEDRKILASVPDSTKERALVHYQVQWRGESL